MSESATAAKTSKQPNPLRLVGSVRDELDRLAQAGYPHEVCGLLVGRVVDGTSVVERQTELRNLAVDRLADRYILDPDGFVAADAAARRDGLDILGIWHTHPDHPARPSQTDLDSAWEGYGYLILSVRKGRVDDVRSWTLDGTRFVEQRIEEDRT